MFTTPIYNSTSCTVDGTDYTATIHYDGVTSIHEFECYDAEQIAAYTQGHWAFVGIVVTAERGGVYLGTFASLWGIESNSSPDYLLEVANDLLQESIPEANEARKRIALAMA
jgi:hypothetical protein